MIELGTLVSGGAAIDRYRDVANEVLAAVEQIMRRAGARFSILNWDWREEPPGVVPRGDYAALSLRMVERSNVLVALLADTVPTTTREEILHSFELRSRGRPVQVLIFVERAASHDRLDELIDEVRDRFGEQIMYQQFQDEFDLQRKLFVALVPLALALTGFAAPEAA